MSEPDDIQPLELVLPEGGDLGIITLYAPVADLTHTLTAEEAQAIASAVDKRRQEYATGRWLAHSALSLLGFSAGGILSGPRREPLWPQSVLGSITHDRGHVAVAVTANLQLKGIGIDLEKCGRVGDSILRKILTESERNCLGKIDPTLVFSAKEACYKVLYPMFEKYVEFQAVEIDVEPADSTFKVRYVGDQPEHAVIEHARGSYLKLHDSWFTSVVL